MRLTLIGATVGCVVLGLLIASLFIGWSKGKRVKASVVTIVLAAIGFGVMSVTLMPHLQRKAAFEKAIAGFDQNPAIQALKQHDELTYQVFLNDYKKTIDRGMATQEQMEAANSELLIKLNRHVRSRVPTSSDAAAVQYFSALAKIITKVQDSDSQACYDLTHGGTEKSVNLTRFLTPELQAEQYKSYAAVITSSATQPMEPPYKDEVAPVIEPIVQELIRLFGRDLLVALAPNRGELGPARLCAIEAAIWRITLKQPPEQSGKAAKYFIAQIIKRPGNAN